MNASTSSLNRVRLLQEREVAALRKTTRRAFGLWSTMYCWASTGTSFSSRPGADEHGHVDLGQHVPVVLHGLVEDDRARDRGGKPESLAEDEGRMLLGRRILEHQRNELRERGLRGRSGTADITCRSSSKSKKPCGQSGHL